MASSARADTNPFLKWIILASPAKKGQIATVIGIDQGKKTVSYRTGGARGEVVRGTAADPETTVGATSSGFATGSMAMTGDCAATTEPAVEHTGQT